MDKEQFIAKLTSEFAGKKFAKLTEVTHGSFIIEFEGGSKLSIGMTEEEMLPWYPTLTVNKIQLESFEPERD